MYIIYILPSAILARLLFLLHCRSLTFCWISSYTFIFQLIIRLSNEMAPHAPLIFGTMTFGEQGKNGVRTNALDHCQEILDVYNKHGGNELDTARVYAEGTTEEYLAKLNIHRSHVDTKAHPYEPGAHSTLNLRKSVEDSIQALGKGIQIRTLYLHWPDRSTPFEETLRAADTLFREGKFEQLGLSNFAAWEVAEIATLAKVHNLIRPSVYQAMYNGLTRAIEEELVPCLRYWDIRLVVYNPLAGGLLTGKIQRDNQDTIVSGSRFDTSSTSSKMASVYQERYFREKYFDAIDLIKKVVDRQKITLVEAALRWLQHHSILTENDGVIIGASSSSQLEANLIDSAKGPLPKEVVEAIDSAWLLVKGHGPLYWR